MPQKAKNTKPEEKAVNNVTLIDDWDTEATQDEDEIVGAGFENPTDEGDYDKMYLSIEELEEGDDGYTTGKRRSLLNHTRDAADEDEIEELMKTYNFDEN
jgi:hypothetical protein